MFLSCLIFFLIKCVTGSLSLYLMAASFVKFPIKYLPFQKVSHSTHHNRLVQSSTEQRQKDISLSLAHLNKLFFIGPNNPDYRVIIIADHVDSICVFHNCWQRQIHIQFQSTGELFAWLWSQKPPFWSSAENISIW